MTGEFFTGAQSRKIRFWLSYLPVFVALKLAGCFFVLSSFLTKITLLSWAWAGWRSCELCVLPESKPLVSFQAACFVSLRPSPVPPLFFLPPVAIEAATPSKPFSPVVLLVIQCKYPKGVSFYILYFCHHWQVLLGLCEACNNGKSLQVTKQE